MNKNFVCAQLKIKSVSSEYLEIDWISFLILLIHACRWLALHARYNVVSSVYCKDSLSAVICDICAMHELNSIGPNIKLCGTPNSDVKRVEKCVSICTNAVKKLNNSLPKIERL